MAERLVDLPEDQAFGQIEYDLRDLAHDLAATTHQTGLTAGKKKGYTSSSLVCPHCQHDARFVEYRPKTWLTANGEVRYERAYYHCRHCRQGYFPFDQANHLQSDHLSTGLRPLVCLAGTLAPFRDAADDLLRRFSGLRLSAVTVRTATEDAGRRLAQRQQGGDIVCPPRAKAWDFRLEGRPETAAFVGLDAFSVPQQRSGGGKAEHRMLYTAVLYTPDKTRSHYLVDFDLDRLGRQLRQAATRLGLGRADQLVALTDAGNGIEATLRRHFRDDLPCVLDWYHASEHLHEYAKVLHPGEAAAAAAWAKQAKDLLWEQGGTALLMYLRGLPEPAEPAVAEAWRQLLGYFTNHEHRTDYPAYRARGWDVGSGPVEAACKVVGARLKGSGMRWLEAGAAEVAPLRALYQTDPAAWDAFWNLAV
jgi:hypothetical protein